MWRSTGIFIHFSDGHPLSRFFHSLNVHNLILKNTLQIS